MIDAKFNATLPEGPPREDIAREMLVEDKGKEASLASSLVHLEQQKNHLLVWVDSLQAKSI
jgi:hypothetical protein